MSTVDVSELSPLVFHKVDDRFLLLSNKCPSTTRASVRSSRELDFGLARVSTLHLGLEGTQIGAMVETRGVVTWTPHYISIIKRSAQSYSLKEHIRSKDWPELRYKSNVLRVLANSYMVVLLTTYTSDLVSHLENP